MKNGRYYANDLLCSGRVNTYFMLIKSRASAKKYKWMHLFSHKILYKYYYCYYFKQRKKCKEAWKITEK